MWEETCAQYQGLQIQDFQGTTSGSALAPSMWPGTNKATICIDLDEYKKIDNSFESIKALVEVFSRRTLSIENFKKCKIDKIFDELVLNYQDYEVAYRKLISAISIEEEISYSSIISHVFPRNTTKSRIKTVPGKKVDGIKLNYLWIDQHKDDPDLKGKWVALKSGKVVCISDKYNSIINLVKENDGSILITKML